MTKTFNKGDRVTFFQNWDRQGSVRVVDLTVYSAGAKRMVLVDAAGIKFEGHQFYPTVLQVPSGYAGDVRYTSEVHPRGTQEETDVKALELGQRFIDYERDHFDRCIAGQTGSTWSGAGMYIAEMNRQKSLIHEPRIVRLTEDK